MDIPLAISIYPKSLQVEINTLTFVCGFENMLYILHVNITQVA